MTSLFLCTLHACYKHNYWYQCVTNNAPYALLLYNYMHTLYKIEFMTVILDSSHRNFVRKDPHFNVMSYTTGFTFTKSYALLYGLVLPLFI
jgi:hypothetical protein